MKIISSIPEIQKYSRIIRKSGKTLAVVPTMGYLHDGHASLITIAKQHADTVIVTIFVNPTQFAPSEDLDKYPRDFERDKKLCKICGTDAVFTPSTDEMYCKDFSTWVTEEKLSKVLCGQSRPNHFRGVATVVTKLFNATLPDIAVFGQKDYQQAQIIKRMVRDLNFPVKIITVPTVREKDGLAMSSRNSYLNPDERKNAVSIYQSLKAAEDAIKKGELNPQVIKGMIKRRLLHSGGKIDYMEMMDAKNLEPVKKIKDRILIAVAVFYGKTRLIDNVLIEIKNKISSNP